MKKAFVILAFFCFGCPAPESIAPEFNVTFLKNLTGKNLTFSFRNRIYNIYKNDYVEFLTPTSEFEKFVGESQVIFEDGKIINILVKDGDSTLINLVGKENIFEEISRHKNYLKTLNYNLNSTFYDKAK